MRGIGNLADEDIAGEADASFGVAIEHGKSVGGVRGFEFEEFLELGLEKFFIW